MTTSPNDPRASLMAMIHGNWVARILYVAAELGLADHLREGGKTADELAPLVNADPGALSRLLRTLCGLGVFQQETGDRFLPTPLGALLDSQSSDSLRAYTLMVNGHESYLSWENLLYSIQTGEAAFEYVFGDQFLNYAGKNAEFSRLFAQAMAEKYKDAILHITQAYDFSSFHRIVDVGGGYGQLLWSILGAHPHIHGVLFDLPKVIEHARSNPQNLSLSARLTLVGGDCFDQLPADGDGYVMKSFINNWNDADAVTVLKNCRQAMGPASKLLIIEPILLPANEPDYGKLMDLMLLVLQKSQERSREELEKILHGAGFSIHSVTKTQSEFSVLEARPN
jgi:hypothetical protein